MYGRATLNPLPRFTAKSPVISRLKKVLHVPLRTTHAVSFNRPVLWLASSIRPRSSSRSLPTTPWVLVSKRMKRKSLSASYLVRLVHVYVRIKRFIEFLTTRLSLIRQRKKMSKHWGRQSRLSLMLRCLTSSQKSRWITWLNPGLSSKTSEITQGTLSRI